MRGTRRPSYSEEATGLTEAVKEKALSAGAELVGILSTESIDAVPRHWVGWDVQAYTRKSEDYMVGSKSIVVLGYQAWDDAHEMAIPRGGVMEYPVYQRMNLYARRVLRFLEGLGYRAVIYPTLLSQKRMAQLAGLGSFGKNSLIINPRYGPWIRLQSILTDAVLVPDEPFEEDLCGDCEECIEACPVGALSPYRIDSDRCLIGVSESDMGRIITENVDYDAFRDIPDAKSIFDEHMSKLTENSILMCMTCQKACPYGREERGL